MAAYYLLIVLAFPAGMVLVQRVPEHSHTTICAFRLLTGLDCPSCGMTRAFRAMSRLDVAGAFRYNPLGPVTFAVALGLWGWAAGQLLTGQRLRWPWWERHRARAFTVAISLFLVVGVGRLLYQLRYPPPPMSAPAWLHVGWPAPPQEGRHTE